MLVLTPIVWKRFHINLFHSIEVWSQEECVPVVEKNLTPNMMIIGAVLGLILALILCSIHYILDDSIYVETDFTSRFSIPFLGMLTRNSSALCKQELKDNLNYLLKEDKGFYLAFIDSVNETAVEEVKSVYKGMEGIATLQGENLENIRRSNGAVLMIPWGNKNGRVIEKTLAFLKKQDCIVAGVIIYDADEKFLKKYYGRKICK